MKPTSWRNAVFALLAAVFAAGTIAVAIPVRAQTDPAPAPTPEYAKNSALCMVCHKKAQNEEPPVTEFWEKTKHFTAEGEGPRYHFRDEEHVGCQACHGPGKLHQTTNPKSKMDIHLPIKLEGHNGVEGHQEQLSICARCHAQYEGDFPADYVYGENIMDKLQLKEPAADTKLQQINEMKDSKHFTTETAPTCVVCHTGHKDIDENLPSQIRKPILELCSECHTAQADLSHSKYTTIPDGATCATCHMPGKKHIFKVPAPAAPAQ